MCSEQAVTLSELSFFNDHTVGWQKSNLLSHPNATLAPQARQARASGENFNYVTPATEARQPKRRNFELLAESLV